MKNIKSLFKYFLAFVMVVAVNNACTNLDEKLYNEIPGDEYNNIIKNLTPAQINSAVQGAYARLAGSLHGSHNGAWSDNEVSTDELLVPQRGGDWFDGGQWLRMHRHEYTPNEESINNAWNDLYRGIAVCNRLMVQIPLANPTLGSQLIPELRALRAYFYYMLCDMFGNVPIITKFPGDINEGAAKKRAEVYAFIESELNAIQGSLSKTKTYGRFNYWTAKALLAKLYLNAQQYKGAPEWAKVVSQCDEIIDSKLYSLESDYFANFKSDNEGSRENIFVVPYDDVNLCCFQIMQMTGHYETQKTFNLRDQPWNGYCSLQEFYNSYDTTDRRRANFLAGPQFAADGTTRLTDNGAEANDPDGKPITFTPAINEHFPNCLRQAGVRVGKFRPKLGALNTLGNDFPIFRYGDVLLMKAEALWRQNNGDATALQLVNQIRTRAGVANLTSLTAANFLAELGREKFAEGWRRQDMIRFGKYFQPYDKFKTSNDQPCKGLFPIPQNQIDANKQLPQNECYN